MYSIMYVFMGLMGLRTHSLVTTVFIKFYYLYYYLFSSLAAVRQYYKAGHFGEFRSANIKSLAIDVILYHSYI